jgi:hypothetical protein
MIEGNIGALRDAADANERHNLLAGVDDPLDRHLRRPEDLEIAVPRTDHRISPSIGARARPAWVLDVLDLAVPPALGGLTRDLLGRRSAQFRPHLTKDFDVLRAHGDPVSKFSEPSLYNPCR